MTNNYILRRIRYTFDFNDKTMIAIWALADTVVTREQMSIWLKKDDDPDFLNCSDRNMAIFLNGLINKLRGKKEGPQKEPESRINNNIILRKLKIALNHPNGRFVFKRSVRHAALVVRIHTEGFVILLDTREQSSASSIVDPVLHGHVTTGSGKLPWALLAVINIRLVSPVAAHVIY